MSSTYYFYIIGAVFFAAIICGVIYRRYKLRQEQAENETNNINNFAATGDVATTNNDNVGRDAATYNYSNDPSNHDVVYGQPQQYNNINAYGAGTYGAPPANIYGNNTQSSPPYQQQHYYPPQGGGYPQQQSIYQNPPQQGYPPPLQQGYQSYPPPPQFNTNNSPTPAF